MRAGAAGPWGRHVSCGPSSGLRGQCEPLTRYCVPAAYEIDQSRRLVVSHAWGVLSDVDVREHYAQIRADPAFDPSYRQLADLRAVTEIAVSSVTVAETARTLVFAPGVRRAFIAPQDLHFGMARMFGTYGEASGQDVRVFRDVGAAQEWLGL